MSKGRVLVTGGAGFIGRWVVKRFLDGGSDVVALDDLSNGSKANLEEFSNNPSFGGLIEGDIRDMSRVEESLEPVPDIVVHAAAQINVQSSLDDPATNFEVNVMGTNNILEAVRARMDKKKSMVVMIGTCMVYDTAGTAAISEAHPLKPASPYAASKLAGEFLAESYHHGFGIPVTILRPFNTYGPFQKTNMEGGVVAIFVKRDIEGQELRIFGEGTQTRDLLYVEDCAEFVHTASLHKDAVGGAFNAGTGKDITINDLAAMIASDPGRIKHVPHHHPQSEVQRLLCDPSKAMRVLGWRPRTTLEEGVSRLRSWLKEGG